LRIVVLIPVGVLVIAATTLLGPTRIEWAAITDVTWREVVGADQPSNVFWHLRVPRSLLAAVAGAGLAIGGVIFQTLFRNPLATPYTLGIASGASLAAALGFLSGWQGTLLGGIPRLVLLAFGGAMIAMSLVFLMSRLRRGKDMTRLLLAGVCVAYMCSAGVLLITYLADRAVTNDIVVWMMGSLGTLRPRAALEITIVLVPVLVFALCSHRSLDLLMLGNDVAASRGVHVERTVWISFGLVGLLTAIVVANCGPIGFVGLMVPHMARAVFGVRALPLVVGAAVLGAVFLAICDGLARSLPVVELPVGVTTNILGAVFFFYMLARHDFTHNAVRP